MVRGGHGLEAERYVIDRVGALSGWTVVDANAAQPHQPGFDVIARHHTGRDVRISVKSKATGNAHLSFEIGRSFRRHPADVYAFVDSTQAEPWPVYLAGARTVERLAMERHGKYQQDRGRDPGLNSWSPKLSRRLLEAMGAREFWALLDKPWAAELPVVTEQLLAWAREDAPHVRSAR